MIAKTLLSVAAIAQLATLALGHGRLIVPGPLINDDVGSSSNFPCGSVNVQQVLQNTAPLTVTAGGDASIQWQITNGDGAGPLAVQIDPTGTARNFQTVQITQQIPGVRGNLANANNQRVTLGIRVPAGLQCSGPGARCLLKVAQADAGFTFGSCGALLVAGQAAAPAPAPKQPAAGTGAGTGAGARTGAGKKQAPRRRRVPRRQRQRPRQARQARQ